jgi:hypothetical protein
MATRNMARAIPASLQQEAANVVAAAVLDPAATAPQSGREGQVRAITSGS